MSIINTRSVFRKEHLNLASKCVPLESSKLERVHIMVIWLIHVLDMIDIGEILIGIRVKDFSTMLSIV